MPRRLIVRTPLEVAKHQRRPEPLGEPLDLLVEHPPQLGIGLGAALPGHKRRRTRLMPAATGGGRPGTRRRSVGHLMQPGTQ